MTFSFRNSLVGGSSPFGVISMNFGGGGEATPDPGGSGDDTGLGGPGLTIEVGESQGVGLSPTSGLTKRTI